MKKYYLASIVILFYIPIVTIGGELLPPLKNFFKTVFWHHWLGKSVVLIILYILLVILFGRLKDIEDDESYLSWMLGLSLSGALIILLFFTFEYLKIL